MLFEQFQLSFLQSAVSIYTTLDFVFFKICIILFCAIGTGLQSITFLVKRSFSCSFDPKRGKMESRQSLCYTIIFWLKGTSSFADQTIIIHLQPGVHYMVQPSLAGFFLILISIADSTSKCRWVSQLVVITTLHETASLSSTRHEQKRGTYFLYLILSYFILSNYLYLAVINSLQMLNTLKWKIVIKNAQSLKGPNFIFEVIYSLILKVELRRLTQQMRDQHKQKIERILKIHRTSSV